MKNRLKKIVGGLAIAILIGMSGAMHTYALVDSEIRMETGFSNEDLEFMMQADEALQRLLSQKSIMALVYLSDYYQLRSCPDEYSESVVLMPSGQQVRILDVVITESLESWVEVSCVVKNKSYIGYVQRKNLACSDEEFLAWEMEFGMNPAGFQTMLMTMEDEGLESADEEIEMFSESYQDALYALKAVHPNWIFVKMNTGLDWDTVVTEELKGGRNLVNESNVTAMKEGLYGQNWYYASKEALEFYLDPRNGLEEDKIFQFEHLVYNESYHTQEALQRFLDNTFMKGQIPKTDTSVMTYAYALTAIGREFKISPFHLASRIYQEQGDGTSPLISGNYTGADGQYIGYYNYYNIGSTGSSDKEVIEKGLAYAAKQEPKWDSPYNSLHFGAKIIAANYVGKGQDTLYLQKFDVDDSDGEMYWHQYMQNVSAPGSEAKSIKKLYENSDSLNNAFVFKIPVYENMPESICEVPTTSNRIVLNVLEGYKDQKIYLDGEPVNAEIKNDYYVAEAVDENAKMAVMYQYNENNIPVGMTVWNLHYDGSGYLAEEIEELKDLLSYHGFSIRITGRSGIRYISGISQETKNTLVSDNIEGYKLKEYGTLVLPKTLLGESVLTKNTEKVATGVSYGMDGNDQIIDKVLEEVEGRAHFASVLIGLPVEQYKTEFVFRSYIVLVKDEEEFTVYGPQNQRSIYNIASQILNVGMYPEGSGPNVFMKQLISDADTAIVSDTDMSNAE